MKRIALIATIALLLLVPGALAAHGDEAVDALHDNLVQFGQTVVVTGEVDGDVIVGGSHVTIAKDAKVHGDVLAAAETLEVLGTVEGSVRAGAQRIVIGGSVGRNITVAAQQVEFGETATVAGTTGIWAQDTQLAGIFARNVTVYADHMVLAGTMHASADLRSGAGIDRTSQPLVIEGDLSYRAPTELQFKDGEVHGHVAFVPVEHENVERQFHKAFEAIRVIGFFGALVIGLLLLALFPRFFSSIGETLRRASGPSTLWGIALFFLVPIITVLLMVTLIGIPLAILLLALYACALALGKFIIGAYVGKLLAQRFSWKRNPYVEFLIGFTLVELVFTVLAAALASTAALAPIAAFVGLLNVFLHVWVLGAIAVRSLELIKANRPAKS